MKHSNEIEIEISVPSGPDRQGLEIQDPSPVRRTELGASLVEYALLIALIALALLAATKTLGEEVDSSFNDSSDKISIAAAAG